MKPIAINKIYKWLVYDFVDDTDTTGCWILCKDKPYVRGGWICYKEYSGNSITYGIDGNVLDLGNFKVPDIKSSATKQELKAALFKRKGNVFVKA